MGMQLNTGDTGRAVSPAADGSLYSKIFGSGCYVLSGGNEFKAEIQSNNLIKIYDGDLIMQGRHSYIPASDSDNVTINNGSQGMNRKDLIVARYTKDSTGVEDVMLQVVQGTATSGAATAPGYTDGDILKGATAKDFPLYEVSLNGINITEVKKLFKVLGTNEDLVDKVTEFNGKINHNSNKHILIGKWSSAWNLSDTAKNIGSKKAAVDNEYYKTTTGADSAVTVKKSGLYYVSMYAQGSAASGASASIQAQVVASATVVDDAYVLFGAGYSYNGLSANINIGRVVFLQAGTVLTPQLKKSSASGAASTTGSSYMEVVHIY